MESGEDRQWGRKKEERRNWESGKWPPCLPATPRLVYYSQSPSTFSLSFNSSHVNNPRWAELSSRSASVFTAPLFSLTVAQPLEFLCSASPKYLPMAASAAASHWRRPLQFDSGAVNTSALQHMEPGSCLQASLFLLADLLTKAHLGSIEGRLEMFLCLPEFVLPCPLSHLPCFLCYDRQKQPNSSERASSQWIRTFWKGNLFGGASAHLSFPLWLSCLAQPILALILNLVSSAGAQSHLLQRGFL